MSGSDPMKPASPHLIVGLACNLPKAHGLNQLVSEHFSPINSSPDLVADANTAGDINDLFRLAESAFFDTGLAEIPHNTAIFLAFPPSWNASDAATGLRQYFRALAAADFTVMLAEDSQKGISEALSWLDRGECEYAMVLAGDSFDPTASRAAAAVLFASSNAALRDDVRSYASIVKHDFACDNSINPKSVSLLEACSPDWLTSSSAAQNWVALRKGASDSPQIYPEVWTKHDELCFVSALSLELVGSSQLLLPLIALISSSLSLYLRILPSSAQTLELSGVKSIAECKQMRPWIHPVSPVELQHPRRAFIDFSAGGLLLSEHGTDIGSKSLRHLKEQSSELFVFSEETLGDLRNNLFLFSETLSSNEAPLYELAYLNNCVFRNPGAYQLAIVARNNNELLSLMRDAIDHLDTTPDVPIQFAPNRSFGIYYTADLAQKSGKLAFVLPGLGASYPQMLADLCCYFPEVRQAFDFVERLALKLDDKILPSRAVFPISTIGAQSSQAMLATMDSAVITLLLAEWALFALLKKLGVEPDAFLGCSTGEFAALTMCEAIDLFQSAELFYQLSTHVSRSIDFSELSELRSVRVSASFDDVISPILSKMPGKIYMSADMSDSCVLLSGNKSVMDELCRQLKANQIDYLILPVAIPYHTSLVAGKVSDQDADVQRLKMLPPSIEAWSCSTECEYPESGDALRKISTGLFEKPIRLRSTVLKMYDAGTRIFIELGPKGGLVPYISEVLAAKEHLSLAVNVPGRSGIDQLNVMLAILSCNGVELNLAALYERRVDSKAESRRIKQFFAAEEVSDYYPSSSDRQNEMSLELGMEIHRSDDFENETLQMSNSLYDFMQWSQPNYNPQDVADLGVPNAEWAPFFAGAGLSDEIMITYLSTMQQFHNSLMNTQERLMMAYLLGTPEEASEFDSYGRAGEFPFFPNAALQTYDDCFLLEFSLSTLLQPFLLDHAIGGSVSTNSNGSSGVHLLPLMVALEVMAEGASLLYPHLNLVRISDVRAYKRIRVTSKIMRLTLELRANTANVVDARICMQDLDQDDSSLLASCQLEFASEYPLAPSPSAFPVQDEMPSKLSPEKLYCEGSMFHGPRMQAVESIDLVSKRTIGGYISCRNSDDWFSKQAPGEEPGFVVDPLILDNASQFVLYQMYEHNMPATALLPFHIVSIEFFDGFKDMRGKFARSNAFLRAMSKRGTEAQVELLSPEGSVVAKINDISSRAIMLPAPFREFVADPSKLLCRRLNFDFAPQVAISAIAKSEMPDDETTLDWFTDYVLTANEQATWKQVGRTEKRRLDWLSGRIAVKDAIRMFVMQEFNLSLRPADIDIQKTAGGSLEVLIKDFDLPYLPQISLSHCATLAVAIAEFPNPDRQSGIDVETADEREDGFDQLAFTESERKFLSLIPKEEHPKMMSLLWTAKESAAKACGSGLAGNPKLFEMRHCDLQQNQMSVQANVDSIGRSGLYQCFSAWNSDYNVCLSFVQKFESC